MKLKISKNLAYIAGLLRDGSISKSRNNLYEIQISQKDRNFLNRVFRIMKRVFPEEKIKLVQYGKQTPRIKIYSKKIYFEIIELLEYPGVQSRWSVPSCIKDAQKEIKKYFIRGFFDAEGEVPLSLNQSGKFKVWVRFHHSWDGNKCIVLKEIKKILENDFGIQCGKISGPKKEKNIPSFDLMIYGEHAKKFMREIGVFHPKHKKRFRIQLGN